MPAEAWRALVTRLRRPEDLRRLAGSAVARLRYCYAETRTRPGWPTSSATAGRRPNWPTCSIRQDRFDRAVRRPQPAIEADPPDRLVTRNWPSRSCRQRSTRPDRRPAPAPGAYPARSPRSCSTAACATSCAGEAEAGDVIAAEKLVERLADRGCLGEIRDRADGGESCGPRRRWPTSTRPGARWICCGTAPTPATGRPAAPVEDPSGRARGATRRSVAELRAAVDEGRPEAAFSSARCCSSCATRPNLKVELDAGTTGAAERLSPSTPRRSIRSLIRLRAFGLDADGQLVTPEQPLDRTSKGPSMAAELTAVDYAFLIVLKAAGREISNTEMDQLYEVPAGEPGLPEAERGRLRGPTTKRRPYRHALTEEGRKCSPSPLTIDDDRVEEGRSATAGERQLWAAFVAQQTLCRQKRHPDRDRARPTDLDGRIRAAYRIWPAAPGEWVESHRSATAARRCLEGRTRQGAERMLDAPDVRLEPEPFGHRISAEDRTPPSTSVVRTGTSWRSACDDRRGTRGARRAPVQLGAGARRRVAALAVPRRRAARRLSSGMCWTASPRPRPAPTRARSAWCWRAGTDREDPPAGLGPGAGAATGRLLLPDQPARRPELLGRPADLPARRPGPGGARRRDPTAAAAAPSGVADRCPTGRPARGDRGDRADPRRAGRLRRGLREFDRTSPTQCRDTLRALALRASDDEEHQDVADNFFAGGEETAQGNGRPGESAPTPGRPRSSSGRFPGCWL